MIEMRNDEGLIEGTIKLVNGELVYAAINESELEFLIDLIENDKFLPRNPKEKYSKICGRFSNCSRMIMVEV